MLFALIFVFQCDHQDCGKDFHKRNQLKTHKCEHQQLLPYQWVATHVMQPTFSLICTWPAKILTFFLFKFLYIVVPSVAVQENFPLMENWSIMRECMEVCWQQENLFILIGVFNLGGGKTLSLLQDTLVRMKSVLFRERRGQNIWSTEKNIKVWM